MVGRVIGSVVAVLLLVVPAQAQAGAVFADEIVSQRVLEVARAPWAAYSPCHGQELLSVEPNGSLYLHPWAPAQAGPYCTIGIEVQMFTVQDEATLCALLTHEFGHLAGHWRHTRGTIMSDLGREVYSWPACVALRGRR